MERRSPVLTPETLVDWRRWWLDLNRNPIYLREFGRWGKPNRFYDSLVKYAPFIIIIGMAVGGIGGIVNSFGSMYSDGFATCLGCFPAILLSIIAFYGFVMGPALTVPAVNQELIQGSWDILRLTPIGTFPIVMAKLFGGLARLRIWMPLFLLGILQTIISIFGLLVDQFILGETSWAEVGLVILFSLIILFRPMLEYFFTGTLGIYIAFWMKSTELALTVTYLSLMMIKVIFIGLAVWISALLLDIFPNGTLILIASIFPFLLILFYGLSTAVCLWQIKRKCETVYFSGD